MRGRLFFMVWQASGAPRSRPSAIKRFRLPASKTPDGCTSPISKPDTKPLLRRKRSSIAWALPKAATSGWTARTGPIGSYFCGYTLPNGYGAAITNGHEAVDLRVAPGL